MKMGYFGESLVGSILLVLLCYVPASAKMDINVDVSVPLPQSVVISTPPTVVVIPGTYAYFVPDIDADIIFYHGYWYHPYEGRWLRAASYNGPWGYVDPTRVPGVLIHLPRDYRHIPLGHERIPYGQLKKNWGKWERERHWDKHVGKERKERNRGERREHKEKKAPGKGKQRVNWSD